MLLEKKIKPRKPKSRFSGFQTSKNYSFLKNDLFIDMAKVEKKSITDLLGSKEKRRPSAAEIEAITQQIHQPSAVATPAPPQIAPIAQAAPIVVEEIPAPVAAKADPPTDEFIKRISVNAPVRLYLKAKSKATLQGMTLMAYILKLMDEDTKEM